MCLKDLFYQPTGMNHGRIDVQKVNSYVGATYRYNEAGNYRRS